VDGHEYNVVAIRTIPIDEESFGVKYITIRTPVPKINFVNVEDSQKLEGYQVGSTISVMPPFNFPHTIAADIVDHHAEVPGAIGNLVLRPPLQIRIVGEDVESEFTGELKEVLAGNGGWIRWTNRSFRTLPDEYTELALPSGELYLLTGSWVGEDGKRVKFWYRPGESLDLYVDPSITTMASPVTTKASSGRVVVTLSAEPPAQAPRQPRASTRIYVVQRGDHLWRIARQYGTTVQRIMRANNIKNPDLIFAGQRLVIP